MMQLLADRTPSRANSISVTTIANPLKMAPATKYGGKIVVCQPGDERGGEVEGDDRVHAESTSGVESAARIRYAVS